MESTQQVKSQAEKSDTTQSIPGLVKDQQKDGKITVQQAFEVNLEKVGIKQFRVSGFSRCTFDALEKLKEAMHLTTEAAIKD